MARTVFVSGCFDMLHSGHVEFFKQASAYGDLHVALGSDATVAALKGRPPVMTEQERLFMVKAVSYVRDAFISSGSGYLDFEPELRQMGPDLFVVNADGNTPDKRQLCRELGIEYVVLQREPHPGLMPRSTTELRRVSQMPYRIDLAGGWLDQPFVSKHYPGSVITLSIEPTVEFNDRSGMATSTRRVATELWGNRMPQDDLAKTARILFCCDNPPGVPYVSGAQDTVGLVYPGLAKSHYVGEYWPDAIDHVTDESALRFAENLLYLIPLGPRHGTYDVLSDTRIDQAGARALAEATEKAWAALLSQDAGSFGEGMREAFEAQIAMFPHMLNPGITELIEQYRERALGWKISGAGGGGYLILVAEGEIPEGMRIVARRRDDGL